MSDEPSRPIESIDELVATFRAAEKPVAQWRIGTEHEKIGIFADGHARVPYPGERGIGALLDRLADAAGWDRIVERERVIALARDGATITLEPGGQVELSGAPLRTIRETCREFNQHVELVKRVSDELGIVFLCLGMDPLHDIAEIPVMPKARYDIMRRYLPTRGSLGLYMMHATATVQANFDYASEADMADKFRTALACSPVVSALFANSSFSGGQPNGFASKRLEIWRHTDPDRCGFLPFVFESDFGYRDYVDWVLDVPMFFVVRDGEYASADGMTFRQFLERGFGESRATHGDWETHLTTVFPEVRMKGYLEVRGADAVPGTLICALPALWKGILYDAAACAEAYALVRHAAPDALDRGLAQIARHGLDAQLGGASVKELAESLVRISADGLRRIAERGETDADERSFLDPLLEILEAGRSPGTLLVERFHGEWGGRIERLIESARY
ncbi:MAG: glutamate--cysteine ligase [Proteobacteria bacterium]|nr:glutamate--cysteine ligase [Pseudomonadota bacterium]